MNGMMTFSPGSRIWWNLPRPLDDPGALLRHHSHALDHEHHRQRDDAKGIQSGRIGS